MLTISFWVTCIWDIKDDDKVHISNYRWENGDSERWVICPRLWDTEAEFQSMLHRFQKSQMALCSNHFPQCDLFCEMFLTPITAGLTMFYGGHACMESSDKCFWKETCLVLPHVVFPHFVWSWTLFLSAEHLLYFQQSQRIASIGIFRKWNFLFWHRYFTRGNIFTRRPAILSNKYPFLQRKRKMRSQWYWLILIWELTFFK